MVFNSEGRNAAGGPFKRLGVLVLAVVLVMSLFAFVPVAAAEDAPPPLPAAYHGDVTIDGEPAPAGTVVSASVNGEVRGHIVVDEAGQYGGASTLADKLIVDGDSGDVGEDVTFLVNGQEVGANPAVSWEPGAHQQVNLDGEDIDAPFVDVEIDERKSATAIQPGENATVVAMVTNTGDASVGSNVTFELDGDAIDERSIDLEKGESAQLTFDVQLADEGEYDASVRTIHDSDATTLTVDEQPGPPVVPPAPPDPGESDIQVVEADLSADQIDVGGTVTVTATVENLGNASGLAPISLTVDGRTVGSEAILLDAGEETSLTFTETFAEAGEYTIEVDGTRAGTLLVGTATISVTEASVSDDEVEAGDTIDVTGTVENTGDIAGETTVELLIDGEAVDSQSVSVDAGATTDVTFEHAFEAAGTYEVSVDDTHAGTITVAPSPDPDGGDDSIPGFGVIAALVALFAIGIAGQRRD